MATSMPTAAKAAGAICFGILGWLLANAFIPGLKDPSAVGSMREYNALVGAIVGWSVMGNSVGHRYIDSVGFGWKTAIALVIVSLFVYSLTEMLQKTTRMVYGDPLEAITDIFVRMFKHAGEGVTVPVITNIFVGGALGGFVVEYVSRRWR